MQLPVQIIAGELWLTRPLMEHPTCSTRKHDDFKAWDPFEKPTCKDGQYPSSADGKSAKVSWDGDMGINKASTGSSESSNESKVTQDRRGLIDDGTETDWEEGNSQELKGTTAASPPPKRKRLAKVVLHGRSSSDIVDYALVHKNLAAPKVQCCQETCSACTKGARDRMQIFRESCAVAVTRPPSSRKKFTVLHNVAMVLTFVALVSLWGIVDMLVAIVSGASSPAQFQLYGVLLLIGAMATLALRKLNAESYRGTFYPTLLSSLLTAAGGWGLVDLAVEIAAGGNPTMMLLSYLFVFLGTASLIALHMLLVDRGFNEVLQRFI